MRKPSGKLNKLRADKSGRLNDSLFNFLENLLVFRTLPQLSVRQESSVKFRITRQEGDPGICLLIHIDNQAFPIIEKDVPRPDYLALYLHGDGCLCTIIEMKSKEKKNLKHGLEQIKTLRDRLDQEIRKHLPKGFELHIQGILLCQFNAQVPDDLIRKMAENGLTILPAPFDHRAELYPYISKKNSLKNRFASKPRTPTRPSPIEKMMSQDTLRRRIPDEVTKKRDGKGAGIGLHINFVLSEMDEYAALTTRGRKCVFYVCEDGEQHLERLRADIAASGLGQKFDVEPLPHTDLPEAR